MRVDCLVGTDFLIDRWRNGEASGASAYARVHHGDSLAISWVVKGEFLRAAAIAGYDGRDLPEFLARYPTQWPDEEVVTGYAQLCVLLRERGLSVGANDLWLAASTLRLGVRLITRNTNTLGQVPGIRIERY
jgi:predicted nucleic acid-binding protein